MASETDGTELDTNSTGIEEIDSCSIHDQHAAIRDDVSWVGVEALGDCAFGHCGSTVNRDHNCSEIEEIDNDIIVDSSVAVNSTITSTEIQEIEEIEEIGNNISDNSILDRDISDNDEVDTLSSGDCAQFARMAEMMVRHSKCVQQSVVLLKSST